MVGCPVLIPVSKIFPQILDSYPPTRDLGQLVSMTTSSPLDSCHGYRHRALLLISKIPISRVNPLVSKFSLQMMSADNGVRNYVTDTPP